MDNLYTLQISKETKKKNKTFRGQRVRYRWLLSKKKEKKKKKDIDDLEVF